MGSRDYYAVLEVPTSATAEEIKKSYRRLAREFHPDVATDKRTAEERFKQINQAYEVLGEEASRRRYDDLASFRRGARSSQPPQSDSGEHPPHRKGDAMDDFLNRFFRSRGYSDGPPNGSNGGPSKTKKPRKRKGRDIEGHVEVTLEQVIQGAVCSIAVDRLSDNGMHSTTTVRVRLPNGVQHGQRIRVAAQGQPGKGGGATGDLYLTVRWLTHSDYRVQGTDLYRELPFLPWELVLGTTAELTTLEGPVSIRIPAATQIGQTLRVRGHGLPGSNGGARGDLYLIAAVRMPAQVSDHEKQLWEQLSQATRVEPKHP